MNKYEKEAREKLIKYKSVKKALISVLTNIDDLEKINKALEKTKGHVRNAIIEVNKL